ncbi:MAG: DUF1501 domain-containing protein [Planctomycetota bacterium]|nr:DUF1501 domain-containing protein [Planctomycetota bacterium]
MNTIETKTPGVRFPELVPKLAARSDRFSRVRSNITHDGGHPAAGTLGMTGYTSGVVARWQAAGRRRRARRQTGSVFDHAMSQSRHTFTHYQSIAAPGIMEVLTRPQRVE